MNGTRHSLRRWECGEPMTSGEKLLALRQTYGISQSRLAAAARLSRNTIWQIEQSRRRPTERTLRLLSAAFIVLTGKRFQPDDLRSDPC